MVAHARSESPIASQGKQAGPLLEELFHKYNRADWLSSDPLHLPHEYEGGKDREFVGFISSLFAYGAAPQIIQAVRRVLAPLGTRPFDALMGYGGEDLWPGFYYRFHRAPHLSFLFKALRMAYERYETLEGLYTEGLPALAGHEPWGRVEAALNQGAHRLMAFIDVQNPPVSLRRGLRFLINAPRTGSACKRHLMYFRWMVRRDEVDLGLWTAFSPRELVVPLDTHVSRISHYLRLRRSAERRAPHWAMAMEVTRSLAALDVDDPVRFDFALARLGILDLCKRRFEAEVCMKCPLLPACRYSRKQLKHLK